MVHANQSAIREQGSAITIRTQAHPSINTLEGASAALVGGGIFTMALFPLALPIIALTAIAVLPLALIALVAGLVDAAVAAPILLGRRFTWLGTIERRT